MGEIFWEEFFGRNPYIVSQLIYLNIEGIDLSAKILSQCTRKEDEFQSLEVREASSSHLKRWVHQHKSKLLDSWKTWEGTPNLF